MLKVVFFDGAGTLFHTREPAGFSYAKIARRFGVDADERQVMDSFRRKFSSAPGLAFGPVHDAAKLRDMEREWWRRLVRATFDELGHFADFDAYFDELFAFFADPANWKCDPDAPVLLSALRENGLRLGVISNFDHRIYRILEALGLARYFESVTISSEAGYAKPSPEIFRIALERFALPAAQALHVGDSEPLDAGGARASGIACVLIDSEAAAPPGAGQGAQAAFASCGERCVRARTLADVPTALHLLTFS